MNTPPRLRKLIRKLCHTDAVFTHYDIICQLRYQGHPLQKKEIRKWLQKETERTPLKTYRTNTIEVEGKKALLYHPEGFNPNDYNPQTLTICTIKGLILDKDGRLTIPKTLLGGLPYGLPLAGTIVPGKISIEKNGETSLNIQIQPQRQCLRLNRY